jgi:hypothetical protein
MALKPKTALLQVRMDPDLLAEFQRLCAENLYTPSDMARRLIHHQTTQWQKREIGEAEYASRKALKAAASPFLDIRASAPVKAPAAAPAPSSTIRKENRRPKKGQR